MNNGDSFHNGSENLELQKQNRLGLSEENSTEIPSPDDQTCPAPASAPKPVLDAASSRLAPHERPYVNIYAGGAVSYPGGRPTPATPPPPPEKRNYTNIYAQRVAERPADTQPGVYSNTPLSEEGVPYYEDIPGGDSRSTPVTTYDASDYADEEAALAHKRKINLASLILGIASFAANLLCLTCLTPITAILAIIFGCMGRVAGKFDQRGLVGFVLGVVYCSLMLLGILFIFLAVLLSATHGTV
ncbi:MAG: DUF4190 domain-containing protein [Clostridia bacterium]|nr:DUF4190 domain-containing protein [Clostridia bacterium]